MRKITITAIIAAALVAGAASVAVAGPTYQDRLLSDLEIAMQPESPKAAAFWQCWGKAFVGQMVGIKDRKALDELSAGAWDPNAPLVVRYRERVKRILDNPKGSDMMRVIDYAERSPCGPDIEAYLKEQ